MNKTRINEPLSVQSAFGDLLNRMYISNVQNRLRELNEPTENDCKRWVWELIQNAKDSISNDDSRSAVDIQIIVRDDKVQFRHNGAPFTAKAQMGLLYKYSDGKVNNSESTGRFGTGFLTTHTLSKTVTIEGDVYKDDYSQEMCGFSTTMYRDGIDEDELLAGVKRMRDELQYTEETNDWTTYTYYLKTAKNRDALSLGLENFLTNIAQTMLFCEEINSIKLDNNGDVIEIERAGTEKLEKDLFISTFIIAGVNKYSRRFIHTSIRKPNMELSERFKSERNIRLTACIEVDNNKNIVENIESPSHFCVLPLVGSEKHIMPIYLNSPDFEPDSERESLLLIGDNHIAERGVISEAGINRLILSESIELYEKIVSYLTENKYRKIYLLIKGLKKSPNFEKNFNTDWFKNEIIANYRSVVQKYNIVETNEGNKSLFNSDGLPNVVIPKEKKDKDQHEIYRLTKELFPAKVPLDYCYAEWADLAWKECGVFNIESLCKYVSDQENVENISLDTMERFEWYNQFIDFVRLYDESLFKEYSLIPNRYGELVSLDREEFSEALDVSDYEIDCLKDLGQDLNPILIDERINAIEIPVKIYSKDVASKINDRVGKIIDEKLSVEETLRKLTPLIKTIPTDVAIYDSEFIIKQKNLSIYVRDLFANLYIQEENNNKVHESAWRRYHNWCIDSLIQSVAEYKCVDNLPLLESDKLNWINKFIGFVSKEVKEGVLDKKYSIIPNQKLEFCTKDKLAQDIDIPAELKTDVAERFGLHLRSILLNEEIDSIRLTNEFDIKRTVNLIDEIFSKDNFGNELDDLSFAIFLVHLLPNEYSSVIYNSQKKLLEIVRKFYYKRSENYNTQSIKCSDEGLWSVANKKIKNYLGRDIARNETLGELGSFLSGSGVDFDYGDTIIFLNDYYEYLSNSGIAISGSVVPNQNGILCSLDDDLFFDNNVPETLKDILYLVDSENDFRNILADSTLSSVAQPRHSKSLGDISNIIDSKINELYVRRGYNYDENFRTAIELLMMNWFPKNRECSKDHFPHIYNKKETIEMNVLWSLEERQRMQRARKIDPNLLEAFLEDATQIESIKEEKEKLEKEIEELKSNVGSVNQNFIEISKEFPDLSVERIKELLSLEERVKDQWNAESVYSPHSAEQEKRNFENGYKGEAYVYKQLLKSGNFNNVVWAHKTIDPDNSDYSIVDFEGETHYIKDDYSKYDLSVETKDGKTIFIEVKSTRTNLADADNIALPISTSEWNFVNQINDREKYYLARVFNVENRPEGHYLSLMGMDFSIS